MTLPPVALSPPPPLSVSLPPVAISPPPLPVSLPPVVLSPLPPLPVFSVSPPPPISVGLPPVAIAPPPISVDLPPVAIAPPPISVDLPPVAIAPPPISVDLPPVAIAPPPISVDLPPVAIAPPPISVDLPPVAIAPPPISVDLPPVPVTLPPVLKSPWPPRPPLPPPAPPAPPLSPGDAFLNLVSFTLLADSLTASQFNGTAFVHTLAAALPNVTVADVAINVSTVGVPDPIGIQSTLPSLGRRHLSHASSSVEHLLIAVLVALSTAASTGAVSAAASTLFLNPIPAAATLGSAAFRALNRHPRVPPEHRPPNPASLGAGHAAHNRLGKSPSLGAGHAAHIRLGESASLGAGHAAHIRLGESASLGAGHAAHIRLGKSPILGAGHAAHIRLGKSPSLSAGHAAHIRLGESASLGAGHAAHNRLGRAAPRDSSRATRLATAWPPRRPIAPAISHRVAPSRCAGAVRSQQHCVGLLVELLLGRRGARGAPHHGCAAPRLARRRDWFGPGHERGDGRCAGPRADALSGRQRCMGRDRRQLGVTRDPRHATSATGRGGHRACEPAPCHQRAARLEYHRRARAAWRACAPWAREVHLARVDPMGGCEARLGHSRAEEPRFPQRRPGGRGRRGRRSRWLLRTALCRAGPLALLHPVAARLRRVEARARCVRLLPTRPDECLLCGLDPRRP
ncbi:hypothetical protein Ctob_010390 [Chrysochromulina tobinii]|uniref:Uncharacterized protein n=1 Tax=Chrysochromulina tobinii TaxID=1460289 RepID=A0A0M0K5F3_9EUKA|nr:hypothetical protein Ctob_010390 [Chrysochromulina tobinii]|eukprot:KOO34029.1 hypothetical protein Ctob_010390 [Chrysochromulina sp. CCMP291]